jgi:hypothetical protein
MDSKTCRQCGETKPLELFRRQRNQCKKCEYENSRTYIKNNKEKNKAWRQKSYQKNKDAITLKSREYYRKNKEAVKLKNAEYRAKNSDKVKDTLKKYYIKHRDDIAVYHKQYRKKNSSVIAEKKKRYEKRRSKTDMAFKLRRSVRNAVYCAILRADSKKNGSILKYLPYSIDDLKAHLESLFEPWMSWDNWGVYDSETWDDNDPTTWTWQIDHIIPQSALIYDSMEHPNFQKCWALDNLRPYSAKDNIIECNRKII